MDNGRNSLGGMRGADFDSLRPGVGEMDAGAIQRVEQLAGRVPEMAREDKEAESGIFTAEAVAEVKPVEQMIVPEVVPVVPEMAGAEIGFLDGKKERMSEAGVNVVKAIESKMDDPYQALNEAEMARRRALSGMFGREVGK